VRLLSRLPRETRTRLLLRAVIAVAPVLAVTVASPSGPADTWLVAATVVLALGFAAMPESALGTMCLGLVVVWWAISAAHGTPAGAILAALLLLAAHLASVLLSYGPRTLPVGGPVFGLWVRRGLAVAFAAPLVWLVAVLVDGEPEPPGIWLSALACAVVLCIVAAGAVTVRED
jgi:hypothetical protein